MCHTCRTQAATTAHRTPFLRRICTPCGRASAFNIGTRYTIHGYLPDQRGPRAVSAQNTVGQRCDTAACTMLGALGAAVCDAGAPRNTEAASGMAMATVPSTPASTISCAKQIASGSIPLMA